MRVGLTHAFCWPEVRRGGERLVAELARHLAASGAEVTVLSSAFAAGTAVVDDVTTIRLRRRHDDEARATADFAARVLPRLASGRFDVVHSFGPRVGVSSLRAARLHPRRATVHTDIGIPDPAWWATQGAEGRCASRVVRDVDVYGCMSRCALDALRDGYGRTGSLLPGGVDLGSFIPRARTSAPTILYSGALDVPRKGVVALVEALPLVAAVEPEVRLVLSGPGDPGAVLAGAPREALERTDVLGTGSLEALPELYATSWACALPSVHDTFGLVLVEALASGTPIVAGDSHALPELVEPGGTGALCTPFDPPSIAAACIEALALARRPGTSDRCRASVARFDWRTAVVPRHLEVYEEALARRARGARRARHDP